MSGVHANLLEIFLVRFHPIFDQYNLFLGALMVNWFLPYGFQYSFMFISYCLLLISGESIFSPFSPRAINVPRKNLPYIFRKPRRVFNSTLLRRGYSNMRSRSSSNFWSIPPRCYRIMTCLELIKWYAKYSISPSNSKVRWPKCPRFPLRSTDSVGLSR